MQAHRHAVTPVLQFPSAAASLRALASSGQRKILVTRAFDDDRRSAFRTAMLPGHAGEGSTIGPGGFVRAVATALAGSGGESVLIVEAGPADSVGRDLPVPPSRRGLRELIHEAYLCDLASERAARFGLGDWLEVLDAQGRTGDLLVHEAGETCEVCFVRGSIRAVVLPSSGEDRDLKGAALRARASERIVRMTEMKHPEFRFTERPAPVPAAGPRADGEGDCMDGLFRGLLRDRLRHPFLAQEIAEHLRDTALPNLKRVAPGGRGDLTRSLRRPLELLLDRLSRAFGFVLIDAPPVFPPGPTRMLAGLSGAALLVASVEEARSTGLTRAVDELLRGGANVVGILVV